jgi:hypothetical protein
MPIILATQEAEIRKIVVQSQPRQIVHETLSQKNPSQKRAGGVAQGTDLEFKLQEHKKREKKKKQLFGLWAWLKWQSACLASIRP